MTINRKSGCSAFPRKNRYVSESRAIAAAIGASRRSGDSLRVYRCPDCMGWHLTKQRSRERPTGRKAKPLQTPVDVQFASTDFDVDWQAMSSARRQRLLAEARRARAEEKGWAFQARGWRSMTERVR